MLKKIQAELLKLSERSGVAYRWLLGRLEVLAATRAAQAGLRLVSRSHRYTGRHRSNPNVEYTYTTESATDTLLVQAPQRRRSPAAVLRSHLPKAAQKEAALLRVNRGQVYVGRVSAFQVNLIATIAVTMEQMRLLDEARQGLQVAREFVCS